MRICRNIPQGVKHLVAGVVRKQQPRVVLDANEARLPTPMRSIRARDGMSTSDEECVCYFDAALLRGIQGGRAHRHSIFRRRHRDDLTCLNVLRTVAVNLLRYYGDLAVLA